MHSRLFWLPVYWLLLGSPALAAEPPTLSMTLSSQLHIDHRDMAISEDDWYWLRHKRELIIGAHANESPPLNDSSNEKYEGITADVTALVSQLLGIQVKVISFPDYDTALQALQAGSIDLLANHSSEQANKALIFSQPYAQNRLALFRRTVETRHSPVNLAGLSVAVTRDYSAELQRYYPRARLRVYDSSDEAIAALSFGHADLYVDDILSAYYRINHSYYGYVKFERFAELAVEGYRYTLRADNQRLQRVLDAAIGAIGQAALSDLTKRWVGSGFIPTDKKLTLSADESRWIARHPVVRLLINDDLAPVAFFDSNGVFSGIASELLEMVSLRTGLHFEVITRSGSYPQQIEALQKGEADIAIMTASLEREESLRFSRPFLNSPFVIVTNAARDGKVEQLGVLLGKRVAIPSGHVAMLRVQETYPQTSLIEASSTLDAMNLVYEGKADAAVVSLPAARYYIVRFFQNRLAVADLIHIGSATANFALRRGDTELQSILDKAFLSVPPDELNAISNRWRSPPGMSGQTWRDYHLMITEIVGAAAALLLLSLIWVFYLRRQIKARTKAEQMLNDQLRFVETLTDSMPPPLYVLDINGRMLSCNRSYLESVGLTTKQVLNKTLLQLPEENFETDSNLHSSYQQAMRDGQIVESVYSIRLQGKEVWINHWIQPFQDSNGVTRGTICGWLDITEHRHLIQELKEAKNLADEASRAKTTFLATMSHEIRTPMNAVIGILELALKRADTGRIERPSIEIAYSSAKSLLELIGDILDIARIESGRLSLSPKRANLRELVESVARVFEGLARQKHLSLVLDIDSSINSDVLVDAMRFKQILSNLVSNAIKFTDEGTVHIRISGKLLEATLLLVHLSVEDSGIGISQANQQQLFRPFAQVNRNVQNTEGTGLGLVICRSLCEMMGGRLSMTSALGQGTCIDVELRLQVLEPIAIIDRPVRDKDRLQRRLQVLIVDDHSVNRQLLQQQLSFLGHDVVEAENGLVALDLWRESLFDIIITDCHMPMMNGSELARTIRQEEHERNEESTVILGLTADAQPEEIERCIQAGMDDCLIKPISLDMLEECLSILGQDDAEENAYDTMATSSAKQEAESAVPQLFNLDSLNALTGGEPAVLSHLLDELLTSNRNDLQTLTSLLEKQEVGELAELAHRIKGAARVVKGEQLVESCQLLEKICLDPDVAFPEVRKYAEEIERSILALETALLEQREELCRS